MKQLLRNKTYHRIFWVLVFILVVAISVYVGLQGRQYFRRRNIRIIERSLSPYGSFSPLIIVALIFLSNVIPPLPLPVPLIEMAGGFMFGFWPGAILAWISQIISSLFIFAVSRFVGKRYFQSFLNHRILRLYREYIHKKGAFAVLLVRVTMANPFNIISFLPGLNQMGIIPFTLATAIGLLPEVLLYPFIGSFVRYTRIRFWYIFILVVALSALGPVIMFLVMKFWHPKRRKRRN